MAEVVSFASREGGYGFGCGYGVAVGVDDGGDEAAGYGVAALVFDAGADVDVGIGGCDFGCGDVGAVANHMYIVEDVEPHVAVDAFAIIPSAALGVGVVVEHGDDVAARAKKRGDVELEVDVAVGMGALAEGAVDVDLRFAIYALEFEDYVLALPLRVEVDGFAIPAFA